MYLLFRKNIIVLIEEVRKKNEIQVAAKFSATLCHREAPLFFLFFFLYLDAASGIAKAVPHVCTSAS